MYGFSAVNSGNSVLISNTNRHLIFKERISLVITNTVVDRQSVGTASFSTPVTTQAPPTIFVKLSSTQHSSLQIYCLVLGSPGNWTGFSIYAAAMGGGTLPYYVLDCVVCHFASAGTLTGYGMALYDETGARIYANTDRLVKYSKFTRKWTLTVSIPGYTYYNFTPDVSIASDDYIDVSSLNRGVITQLVYRSMFTSVMIYQNNLPTLVLVTQSSSSQSSPQGVAEMNFCIAICKFPVGIY